MEPTIFAMVGVVLPMCSLDLDKVEVVTVETVQEQVFCNYPNGANIRIEGNFVIVEAP